LIKEDNYIDANDGSEEEPTMTENSNAGDILALTTEIVAAHVSNNTV